jgi:hypothetical protein
MGTRLKLKLIGLGSVILALSGLGYAGFPLWLNAPARDNPYDPHSSLYSLPTPIPPPTKAIFLASVSSASTGLLTATSTAVLSPAFPTITPTQTPIIRAGAITFASPSDLQSGIQTLKAEKKIGFYLNGEEESFERWRLIYREPDECLLEVFDSKGNLERTKYSKGTTTTVDAGKIHQQISEQVPRAPKKLVEFFDLKIDPEEIKDSREILPGKWVPNSSEKSLGRTKSGKEVSIRESLVSVVINDDIDGEFTARGH